MLKSVFKTSILFWFMVTILISPTVILSNAFADNPPESEELQGFTDSEFEESDSFPEIDSDITIMADAGDETSNFLPGLTIGGFFKFETEYGYNRDHKKLSKVKTTLFLESDYKINDQWKIKGSANAFYDFAYFIESRIESRDEFLNETLDDNEYDIALKELYIDGQLNNQYSIKFGRQIVVFGASDYARILDVINPRDLTQPGLISIEDARMPVSIVRLSAVFDKWVFDMASIHEHPGSLIFGAGSDFDYYASIRNPGIKILDKNRPESGFRSSGLAARATKSFNGGDISFVAANTYDDQPYLIIEGISPSGITLRPEYDKYRTFGISGNIIKGSSLFKFEAAFQQNIKLMRNDIFKQINSGIPLAGINTTKEADRLAFLAGFEYTGINNLRLNFEAQVTHILDWENYLNNKENEYRTYLQATYNMMNEALELELLWIHFHPGHGNILRLSTQYALFDGLSIEGGIAFYQSRDASSAIYPYNDQDRLFLRMKYSF
ncbi:MAG: hypothetical protein KAR45_06895 [Desulfobacteraceae bacterium]|nr:hypothetical protein [Desulfobacteraceae bacterium]